MSHGDSIEEVVGRFLAHKRALGRKYTSAQSELRLLVRFCGERDVVGIGQLTPVLLDAFLASRPRVRPKGFNHLLGVVSCLLNWAVAQQLLEVSPLHARRRRVTSQPIPYIFDQQQVRRLFDAAGALPDNARARGRATTYRTIFACATGSGCASAKRAGYESATSTCSAACWSCEAGSSGRAVWCRTAHGSLSCSTSSSSAAAVAGRSVTRRRCSPSTASAASVRIAPARRSTSWRSHWICRCRPGSPSRGCTASGIWWTPGLCALSDRFRWYRRCWVVLLSA
jgi:hypothetical protein